MKQVVLLMIMFAFVVSCTEDEAEEEHLPYPWNLGYFVGEVGKSKVEIENKGHDWVIYPGVYVDDMQGRNMIKWGFKYQDSMSMHIRFTPVVEGRFEIINDTTYDYFKMIARIENRIRSIRYIPLKSPFVIEIDSVRYYHPYSSMPYFYGRMNGVLYNKNNMQDSIVVKDVRFGEI